MYCHEPFYVANFWSLCSDLLLHREREHTTAQIFPYSLPPNDKSDIKKGVELSLFVNTHKAFFFFPFSGFVCKMVSSVFGGRFGKRDIRHLMNFYGSIKIKWKFKDLLYCHCVTSELTLLIFHNKLSDLCAL